MKLATVIQSHRDKMNESLLTAEFKQDNNNVGIDKWFESVLNRLQEIKTKQGRLFFIGNGASSSMSSHFAVDFTKNAGIPSFSNNEGTLLTCFSNDFSYETAYMEILKRYMKPGDALIAISSSGKSKNIINAVDFVRSNFPQNMVIGLSGFKTNNPLSTASNYSLYINADEYGFVESGHAYYLHMLIDVFMKEFN
ncbi:MAG: SIS domain-containing protein [Pseudomonadota bacterium]